jgi:hypothetical protein
MRDEGERVANGLLPFCYPTAEDGAGSIGTTWFRIRKKPNERGFLGTVRYKNGRSQANFKTSAFMLSGDGATSQSACPVHSVYRQESRAPNDAANP